jgi:glycerol-3-phosphate dehydrogenase
MTKLDRRIDKLAETPYDLVVIGGGIFGACATWEAARRGLKVALLEKTDFSHATSANHFKMVHGGIRYLQHGDIVRVRESAHERSALLRIAPHLVKPLPIIIPTYGHGIKGKEILFTAMRLFDLLTWDRNQGLLPEREIPASGLIPRSQILKMFPGIKPDGLTGGALFYDGQMVSPTRLAISFLRSAVAAGATVANYVEVTDLLRSGNRIQAVVAKDCVTSKTITIQSGIVLNAAGPWANRLLESTLGINLNPRPTFSRDLAFVVPKRLNGPCALAFATESKDQDTLLDRGGRHLFAVPWKNFTLIGVWHKVFKESPDNITVSREELAAFIKEVNGGYPSLNLSVDQVQLINTGLTLFGEEGHQAQGGMSFGKRSMLIDHRHTHGLQGLLTLIGVRATTARGMAEKAIDLVSRHLNKVLIKSKTATTPIYGGDLPSLNGYAQDLQDSLDGLLSAHQIQSMIQHYGTGILNVLRYGVGRKELLSSLKNSDIIRAEIIHAVREEAAIKLTDVVFRRTDLATGLLPAVDTLQECAHTMADELGWDQVRVQEEIDGVIRQFPNFLYKFRNEATK